MPSRSISSSATPATGESYLAIDKVVAAAKTTGADAVHPGYGFLAENAAFARACAEAGITFIGPPPEAIELMGDKRAAKQAMKAAGVPCVPGYDDEAQDDATLTAEAKKIGFPVMVKAAAGGGGRGMRRVDAEDRLAEALRSARSEAEGAFGDGRCSSKRRSTALATSSSKCSATSMATSSTSASGTARCSAATRRCSRSVPPPR